MQKWRQQLVVCLWAEPVDLRDYWQIYDERKRLILRGKSFVPFLDAALDAFIWVFNVLLPTSGILSSD